METTPVKRSRQQIPNCFSFDGPICRMSALDANGVSYTVLIDSDMYDFCKTTTWRVMPKGYVVSRKGLLHQFVTGQKYQDHINRNKQDNRKSNLRPSTPALQEANKPVQKRTLSGYKGVSKYGYFRWCARIGKDYKTHLIGIFETKIEAAKAYNEAAIELFGNHAVLNEV
jgi:ribosomal protein L35